MSLEDFNPIPAFIESAAEEIADAGNLEMPDIAVSESLFDNTERIANLMHGLGSIPLSETVELQPEAPETDHNTETPSQDSCEEEADIEEEVEEEPDAEDEPEEEQPRQQKKEQPKKPYSLYDGSESRSAALEMIYIATAIPADDIAA